MHYKLYRYSLVGRNGRAIYADKHYSEFSRAKGADDFGELSPYRRKKDSVLMYLRDFHYDFIGLIGRHSTEREITAYDEREDETEIKKVVDDDYPHAPFVCMPRLGLIACVDGAKLRADAAMSRLHNILAHRRKLLFVVEAITETFDLRKAIKRFNIIEVTFELLPVNPHSDDLGLKLDESRKIDHIRRIVGTAQALPSDPMKLDGGLLTAIQQLQTSGHAKVGFVGRTDDKVEVKVEKPAKSQKLASSDDESVFGENVGVKINIKEKVEYPFPRNHVMLIRSIARKFLRQSIADEDDDE
jgi:hypothetical protein